MPLPSPTLAPFPDLTEPRLLAYLNLKLNEIGQPGVKLAEADGLSTFASHFLALSREKDRALGSHLCPADQRIQDFIQSVLTGAGEVPRLSTATLVLDRPALARALSLQPG